MVINIERIADSLIEAIPRFGNTLKLSIPISEYAKLTDNFFIVGQKPILPNNSKLKNELVCNQMVIYNKINLDSKEDII